MSLKWFSVFLYEMKGKTECQTKKTCLIKMLLATKQSPFRVQSRLYNNERRARVDFNR